MQCIDQAYWGIFPHFEVTRFLSDSVRDSSETCFYFWDYHIPHHFGYSFEIRPRVSPLRHWSIHHSDLFNGYFEWLRFNSKPALTSLWNSMGVPHSHTLKTLARLWSCAESLTSSDYQANGFEIFWIF